MTDALCVKTDPDVAPLEVDSTPIYKAPPPGLEPGTTWVTTRCSTN